MAFKHEQLSQWLAAQAPGETLVSGYNSTFYALTDRRLIPGTRSSVRNRPKDVQHSAPVADNTVYWFDDDEGAGKGT